MRFLWPYLVSFPLTWYGNRFSPCDSWDRPPFLISSANRAWLFVVRIVLAVVGSVGLGWHLGVAGPIGAFGLFFWFDRATFKWAFWKAVVREQHAILDSLRRQAIAAGHPVDETALLEQALRIAKMTVTRNVKGQA